MNLPEKAQVFSISWSDNHFAEMAGTKVSTEETLQSWQEQALPGSCGLKFDLSRSKDGSGKQGGINE